MPAGSVARRPRGHIKAREYRALSFLEERLAAELENYHCSGSRKIIR